MCLRIATELHSAEPELVCLQMGLGMIWRVGFFQTRVLLRMFFLAISVQENVYFYALKISNAAKFILCLCLPDME